MSDDEARLYDPREGDEESENTLNIDAASSSNSATSNHNGEEEADVVSDTASPTSNSEVKHRWFILEPAVFLVFLSMYLSSKLWEFIKTKRSMY